MKIYTKTGDQGKTRLIGGAQVSKSDPRIEAYGSVDELNSCLGLALTHPVPEKLKRELQRIQSELFNVGSQLACEDPEIGKKLPMISNVHISTLESEIDEMSSTLPELKNFIMPGGSPLGATLHLARTICRRAERLTAHLLELKSGATETHELCLIYLNRLSDYLFTAARWSNHQSGAPEILWKNP